jgi:hypothetical protein
VTLRAPPPLGRPLRVERPDGRVEVYDGDGLVAAGTPAQIELEVPPAVSWEAAARASEGYAGFEHHDFPSCFVCGTERPAGDGLHVFAGRVPGTDLVASPWTPPEDVRPELVWAALDCPGAYATGYPERGGALLGRLAARVERVPEPGEPCVVIGWPLGEEGRKRHAGTAVHTAGGELLARGRAIWIVPN